MLSFRSIFIAAAAFVTIASGIPTASPTPHVLSAGAAAGVRGGGGANGGVRGGASGGLGGLGSGLGGIGNLLGGLLKPVSGVISTKRGPTSPGDIFKTCFDGVELVVVKIGHYPYFHYFSIQYLKIS